eukprot:scaffold1890_cov380-Prasinococcus_capsulatus_cf.AAC.1
MGTTLAVPIRFYVHAKDSVAGEGVPPAFCEPWCTTPAPRAATLAGTTPRAPARGAQAQAQQQQITTPLTWTRARVPAHNPCVKACTPVVSGWSNP